MVSWTPLSLDVNRYTSRHLMISSFSGVNYSVGMVNFAKVGLTIEGGGTNYIKGPVLTREPDHNTLTMINIALDCISNILVS